MSARSPRLEWLPPLLVGASAAVAAEVAMSLLLYGGVGFVRSLTTVLAVEGLALAAGLWSAPAGGPELVDRVRLRWLLCLFAFVAAAGFGTAWSVFPALGEGRLGQGMGLALLAAVPLYATGAVLGGMSVLTSSDPGERLAAPGAAAAAGAALGFVLTGLLLPRVPVPGSLLVACLVLLSLGGMIYGGVLGARTEIRELARRPGRGPDVRVRERRTPADDVAVLELLEGAFLRRSRPLEEEEGDPWDVAVGRASMPAPSLLDEERPAPWRALLVGGGASSAARWILENNSDASVDVLERTASVVELGRSHFGTELAVGRDGGRSVIVGNLDDAVIGCDGAYDLVVLDSAALAPIGGIAGLSTMTRRRLLGLLAAGGVLAWGGEPGALPLPEGGRWVVRRYRRAVPHRTDVEHEFVVLVRRDDGERWNPVLGGFKEVPDT